MTRSGLTIKWETGADVSTFRRQQVVNIWIDGDGYAFGTWRGHCVGAFHVDNLVWHVL